MKTLSKPQGWVGLQHDRVERASHHARCVSMCFQLRWKGFIGSRVRGHPSGLAAFRSLAVSNGPLESSVELGPSRFSCGLRRSQTDDAAFQPKKMVPTHI